MYNNTSMEMFEEITKHLLTEKTPSVYISELSEEKDLQVFPFTMLWRLKTCEQSAKYHPEGNVWNHTMLVLDRAAQVRGQSHDERAFLWAALLHDIGKAVTTRSRKGRITSYDHDKAGENLSIEFLEYFTEDQDFINNVSSLVRYHMHMLYLQRNLEYADTKQLLQRVDIEDIALLCLCDRLGRTGADTAAEEAGYHEFLQKLKQLQGSRES